MEARPNSRQHQAPRRRDIPPPPPYGMDGGVEFKAVLTLPASTVNVVHTLPCLGERRRPESLNTWRDTKPFLHEQGEGKRSI
jgi:hypothetical protein